MMKKVWRNMNNIFIDYQFPENEANEIAKIEVYNKNKYRPNTYLHKWWARRCGTTFRYILKQLVDEEEKRNFYSSGGLKGKIIFDPMMGGGTTIHEAIRLEANTIGIDIDPIPVLQTKSSLKYIPLEEKEEIFNSFLLELRRKMQLYYNTKCPICNETSEIQYLLYGALKKIGKEEIIVINDYIIKEEKNNKLFICPICYQIVDSEKHTCKINDNNKKIVSKEKINIKYLIDLDNIPFYKRYYPLIISGYCEKHKEFYKKIDEEDLILLNKASDDSKRINKKIPLLPIIKGPKSEDLINRKIKTYNELFSPRQQIFLSNIIDLLKNIDENNRLWLSLLISTSLEFNSMLCGYKGRPERRPGAIRHVFSHHAYSIPYTSLENNPIFTHKKSGTLKQLFKDRIRNATLWALEPKESIIENNKIIKKKISNETDYGIETFDFESLKNGEKKYLIIQGDSTSVNIPNNLIDYVVTDPPYYDSVQYSDLSHFFRVWLKLFLPDFADWDYDTSQSVVSNENYNGKKKYGELLSGIWKTCKNSLKKDGRLIFTFHNWSPEAWSDLTISLKKNNFILVNRYVVAAENPSSVHIYNLKSIKHDLILVLKLNSEDYLGDWKEIKMIDTSDSYSFCRDCGNALGWFLSTNLSEEQIRREWTQLIERDRIGKITG